MVELQKVVQDKSGEEGSRRQTVQRTGPSNEESTPFWGAKGKNNRPMTQPDSAELQSARLVKQESRGDAQSSKTNDAAAVQKSHPTPKNTPLGYHNRKKNMTKKVSDFEEMDKNCKSPSQITCGSENSKSLVHGTGSPIKAASMNSKNQLIIQQVQGFVKTEETDTDMPITSNEKPQAVSLLEQQDTVLR